MRATLIFLVGLVSACLSGAQESSKPVPGLKKEDLCILSGVVISASDSTPLKKARVTLDNLDSHGQSYFTISNADGKFKLEGVTPGRYTLSAWRNGFVYQSYSRKSPGGQGVVLALERGQKLSALVFKLIRSGVISGRVLDEDGEPIPLVTVEAMRPSYFQGHRQFFPQGRAETNDRGEYRLFDLSPGLYYLSASTSSDVSALNAPHGTYAGEPHPKTGYAPVYYPGGTDPSRATAIHVGPGEEIPSTDFLLFPVRTFRLRGHVVSSIPEETSRGITLWLESRGTDSFASFDRFPTLMTNDGHFDIDDVPPGSYTLTGQVMTVSGKRYSGRSLIDVGNADVEAITLAIGPGIDLPGHIRMEGQSGDRPDDLRVLLLPVLGSHVPWVASSVKLDGDFLLRSVSEADYRIMLQGQPEGSYLKSARLGTDDVLNKPLVIKPGGTRDTLELTLSSAGASVRGKVLNEDSLPVPGARVTLIPEPAHRDELRLYQATTTDQYGKFILRGIAPGDYKIFAWEEIEEGAWQDPDFIRTYEDKGEAVQLSEGADQSVELRVIPAKQSDQNP